MTTESTKLEPYTLEESDALVLNHETLPVDPVRCRATVKAVEVARAERDKWKHDFEEQVWASTVGGRCAYCQEMKLTEEMPEHIASCDKHPMAALRVKLNSYREALEKALSAFSVSSTPLPEDRAAVLEAVALIRAVLALDAEKRSGGP